MLKKVIAAAVMAGCGIQGFGAATPWLQLTENSDLSKFPQIIMESAGAAKTTQGGRAWRGKEDLSARICGGWNADELRFTLNITDNEVINNAPDNSLFSHDAVEVFLAMPTSTERQQLQLIFSAPDANGKIRFMLPDHTKPLTVHPTVSGQRTATGYTLTIGIPAGVFGLKKWQEGDTPAFQLMVDDYDSDDGSATQPRYMTLNGATHLAYRTTSYIPIALTTATQMAADSNLDGYWQLQIKPYAFSNAISCEFPPSGYDYAEIKIGNDIYKVTQMTGVQNITVTNPLPDGIYDLTITPYKDHAPQGILNRQISYLPQIYTDLAAVNLAAIAAEQPELAAGYLELLSGVEYIKTAGDVSESIQGGKELLMRQAVLRGQPTPDNADKLLPLLNLTRNFSNNVNVSFSRLGGGTSANIILHSGNLPLTRVYVEWFDSAEEAHNMLMKRQNVAVPEVRNVAGASEAYRHYGSHFWGAPFTDYQPERWVLVVSAQEPDIAYRVTHAEAMKLGVEAMTAFPDAPKEFCTVPEVDWNQRHNYSRFMVAGTPPEGVFKDLMVSSVGIMLTSLNVRKDNVLYRFDADNVDFAAEILRNEPLSANWIDFFSKFWVEQLAKTTELNLNQADAELVQTGDVHTHTLWSDGTSTPLGLVAESIYQGCDFLVVSDHNTIEGALKYQPVLAAADLKYPLIAGEEVTYIYHHLNAYPLTEPIYQYADLQGVLKAAKAQNAVVQWNHPTEYGIALNDYWFGNLSESGLDATERHLDLYGKNDDANPPIVGSSDTHRGILSGEYTVVLAEYPSGEAVAAAVKSRMAAMVCPGYDQYVYGNARIKSAVATLLSSPALAAEQRRERLLNAIPKVNLQVLLDATK